MADQRDLPGWPKRKLVKDVRRQLASYGIRPTIQKLWLETWAWANKICKSYVYPSWPIPREIASQYIFLLLLEMQADKALKLPFRAAEQQPESLKQRLTGIRPILQIEQKQ